MSPKQLIILFLFLAGCQGRESELEIGASARDAASRLYEQELLVSSLDEIARFHDKHETGLILNEPASQSDIEAAETAFGCALPRELKTLWQWRNGESTDKFIWYHRFLSIEESLAQYRSLSSAFLSTWKDEWIPVFEYEGEWYGVGCAESERDASPVIFYFIESGESIAYTNLTRYMQFITEAMNSGVLSWRDEWWWDSDLAGMSEIHARLNPTVSFPYYAGE